MDTIKNYIEMMFKDLPKTPDVLRMKRNILETMEDRYNELLHEGKSEHEAIGAVIAQFGNIDELKEELGINISKSGNYYQKEKEDAQFISRSEIDEYISFKKTFARMIAIGVVLCILSLLPPMFAFETSSDASFAGIKEAIGIMGMFTMIALGVVLFILYGMKNSRYEKLERSHLILSETDKHDMKQAFNDFSTHHNIKIATGVVLCLLAIAIPGALSVLISSDLVGSLLFVFAAAGVYLLIESGIQYSAYKLFAENQKAVRERKHSEMEDRYYGITMPLATMIFLLIGFCFGSWHPTWIIFPITAILTTIYITIKKADS